MADLRGIDAVLFDKDGTLVDYDASWLPINREAARLAARGDEALAARLLDACGTGTDGRTRPGSLFAAGNASEIAAHMVKLDAPFEADALRRVLDDLFERGAAQAVPICNLAPVLDALPVPLGLATSDGEASARVTLDALSVADRFSFVAGYDSGHGAKPGPGMVHAFARATEAERIAVVGDNTHDMEMARAAGAIAIGVLSGTGTRRELEPLADLVLGSVADLPAIVRRAAARTR